MKSSLFRSISAQGWKCCCSITFSIGDLARFRKRCVAARKIRKVNFFEKSWLFVKKLDLVEIMILSGKLDLHRKYCNFQHRTKNMILHKFSLLQKSENSDFYANSETYKHSLNSCKNKNPVASSRDREFIKFHEFLDNSLKWWNSWNFIKFTRI